MQHGPSRPNDQLAFAVVADFNLAVHDQAVGLTGGGGPEQRCCRILADVPLAGTASTDPYLRAIHRSPHGHDMGPPIAADSEEERSGSELGDLLLQCFE